MTSTLLLLDGCGWTSSLFGLAEETCGDGIDDDRDGKIDEGCPCGAMESQRCFRGDHGQRSVGICSDGLQQCDAASGTEFGFWGQCGLGQSPEEESCEGGLDDDCDGAIDEGCPCEMSGEIICGDSALSAPCSPGVQRCGDDGFYTGCLGANVPQAELCSDALDNDCDGTVNEGCDCLPEPEVCGDVVDNDCDGQVDEPACAGDLACSTSAPGWVPTSMVDAALNSLNSSGVWTGREMIVWGGYSGVELTGEGRIFDPIANNWRFMTSRGAPSARSQQVGIWTGSEMLVWGGWTVPSWAPGGALYDPTSDTWRPMSTAPFVLSDLATWVWTGGELLVLGEDTTGGVVGAVYTLATDTWRTMSVVGAPVPAQHREAVWSGTEMLVWGGENAVPVAAHGAIYTLATDTWRPMATNPALESRSLSATAWTGRELAIWGGRNSMVDENIGYLATGHLYDPVADSWRLMGDAGVPEGRTSMGVATRSDAMIVWGGEFNFLVHRDGNLVPSGGIYDYATDTWTSISEEGAPEGRWSGGRGRIALWTGCSLIVWGGVNNTGGIWTPATD